MKKLALDLDQLSVETFATDAARAPRGTVLGNDDEDDTRITEWCTMEKGCTKTTCVTAYGQNTCEPYCAEA